VAQLVEHVTLDHGVVRSSPTLDLRVYFKKKKQKKTQAVQAQHYQDKDSKPFVLKHYTTKAAAIIQPT